MRRVASVACAVLLCACGAASADVSLPALISDNMVIQQGQRVSIWGKAAPGEKVAVSLGEQHVSAEADAAGRWRVALEPMPAGGPHEMTIAGINSIVVKNILVGEVWLCSGQSNIQVTVSASTGGAEAAAAADYPEIRYFRVNSIGNDVPQDDCKGKWVVCAPQNIRSFSAVSYYFGSRLHAELRKPVGLIYSAVGATVIEAWMERSAFQDDPVYQKSIERQDQLMDAYHKYLETLAQWKKEVEEAA
ncbi:MAG TPA: sialate O-acetylesterase, partial [Phycisphaerae bacterium]|nr:sialate O-acetylesterase [Phycisphaerae bacterium]